MIAEIVDNALDQESEDRKLKVKIELYGSSWDDLAIIVYDNGKDLSMKRIWTNHLNYQTE